MCQLLGMNCAAPTDFTFSLQGFCQRGGVTDKHTDGFGAAVYQGPGLRQFHDTQPASASPIAALMQCTPMRTLNMMAHIRYATKGAVRLENVHPFARELWGIQFCFCHNGECPQFGTSSNNIDQHVPLLGAARRSDIVYHPVGDTDSEAVFCAILNALRVEFCDGVPTLPKLHAYLSQLCHEITVDQPDDTIFNFLLGCGPYTLFAYSWPGARPGSTVWNGLHYLIRSPPFSTATLLDVPIDHGGHGGGGGGRFGRRGGSIDFAPLTTPQDRVAVITTKPLTSETGWREMHRGELLMFDKGKAYRTPRCCEVVEQAGRGLCSRRVPKIGASGEQNYRHTNDDNDDNNSGGNHSATSSSSSSCNVNLDDDECAKSLVPSPPRLSNCAPEVQKAAGQFVPPCPSPAPLSPHERDDAPSSLSSPSTLIKGRDA